MTGISMEYELDMGYDWDMIGIWLDYELDMNLMMLQSIPGLQSYSPCTTESFLGTKRQHGALFAWYLIQSILLARHSWALSFLKAEVQLLPQMYHRCFFRFRRYRCVIVLRLSVGPVWRIKKETNLSRAPSVEVHLARQATHSNPLLGAGFLVVLFLR